MSLSRARPGSLEPIRIGIVGLGRIAQGMHGPSIRGNPAFALAATASPQDELPGVAGFAAIEDMLDGVPELTAVAICTPPQLRYDMARLALERGKHVLLEKPPCCSVARLTHLASLAGTAGRTLFQTWHSRYAHAVPRAARELAGHTLERVRVTWKEDVREWHAGQCWLWQAGGFGVFDLGINPLSILTQLIPEPLFARTARLFVPANCATPIAAELQLETASGVPIEVGLDGLDAGTPIWEIELTTDRGALTLANGGAILRTGSAGPLPPPSLAEEYVALYGRFAELIARGESDVDARPLQLVADLHLVATHVTVDAFAG